MAVLLSCWLYTLSVLCMFLYVSSVNSAEYIPVFMWESSSNSVAKKDVPALATVSTDELKDIVTQKIKDKLVIVVFAEENLSVEDFSWQDEAGEGSFPNLQNASRSPTYLPFVRAPLRAFRLRDWFHLKLGPNDLSPIDDALNETLLLVNLDDATSTEDRPNLLKRHDAIISQVFNKLCKHHGEDVFAVYTAHHSSWQSGEEILTRRVRRLLQADDPDYNANGTVLIVQHGMTLYDLEGEGIELAIPPDQQTEERNTETWEFLKQGVTLKFLFEETFPGYWAMVQVNASLNGTELVLSPKGIEAPKTFSYHCSQEVTIAGNRESKLVMKDIQIQAFVEEGEVFGDAYDCVYFFTVPIWSGLFVCTIFSLIMVLGLSMIMDIKTMDRFDDPKGKTITINVAE